MWERRIVVCGNEELSCVGTKTVFIWERRIIVFGNPKKLSRVGATTILCGKEDLYYAAKQNCPD